MSYKGEILTYVALWILWAVAMAGLVCMVAGCAGNTTIKHECEGKCTLDMERNVSI